MSMVLTPRKRPSVEETTLNQQNDTEVSDGAVIAALIVGVALFVPIFMGTGNAAASTTSEAIDTSYFIEAATCVDAVPNAFGTSDTDGSFALREVHVQGSFGEEYIGLPFGIPQQRKPGETFNIPGPALLPGESMKLTLTVAGHDDSVQSVERLATATVTRPTIAECVALGQEMPDVDEDGNIIFGALRDHE